MGGTRNEHLKLLLEEASGIDDLSDVAQRMAEADIPVQISDALRLCKLTAIRKSEDRVRGLNAGDSLRRLVARTLAQQHAEEFQRATSPFNCGLSVRGGTEAAIHLIRSAADGDPNLVVTKIDGIGAYDHIYRSTMLHKLHSLPNAHKLIPFVLMSYGSTSRFVWNDAQGASH